MGIVGGRALSDTAGPAFGRTIGPGAEAERAAPNMPLGGGTRPTFVQPLRSAPGQEMFPGYPQDMFMVADETVPEGAQPGAARAGIMTARVGKPETYGLRPGWSGATMGMMTIVRVLQPDLFDKITELKAQQERKERG